MTVRNTAKLLKKGIILKGISLHLVCIKIITCKEGNDTKGNYTWYKLKT